MRNAAILLRSFREVDAKFPSHHPHRYAEHPVFPGAVTVMYSFLVRRFPISLPIVGLSYLYPSLQKIGRRPVLFMSFSTEKVFHIVKVDKNLYFTRQKKEENTSPPSILRPVSFRLSLRFSFRLSSRSFLSSSYPSSSTFAKSHPELRELVYRPAKSSQIFCTSSHLSPYIHAVDSTSQECSRTSHHLTVIAVSYYHSQTS